jgi:hypothetical protein
MSCADSAAAVADERQIRDGGGVTASAAEGQHYSLY